MLQIKLPPTTARKRLITLALPTFISLFSMTLFATTNAEADPMTMRIYALFAWFDKPDAPGASVMVIQKGRVLFEKGYGLADLEQKTPIRPHTNFRLASVTKQFTAMAVLLLVERKKLSLEDRLEEFFPEFSECGKQITIRQLLNHTSGLIDYEDVIPEGTSIPVLDRDVLRLLMQQKKTYFAPGTSYRYSNSAYALLALIVEVRSGNTFAQFLKQNIFEPLGMRDTLAYEPGSSVVPHRAYGHTWTGTEFKRTDQSLTSSVLGDGGVYSSVADLFKWDQALYTDKLASQATLELAFTSGPATELPETHYGFGWYIGRYRGLKEIWHSGTTRGFSTRIVRFPDKQFSVIILSNRNEANLSELLHQVADVCLFNGE